MCLCQHLHRLVESLEVLLGLRFSLLTSCVPEGTVPSDSIRNPNRSRVTEVTRNLIHMPLTLCREGEGLIRRRQWRETCQWKTHGFFLCAAKSKHTQDLTLASRLFAGMGKIWPREDIRQIPKALLRAFVSCRLSRPGNRQVIIGGPPCQGV